MKNPIDNEIVLKPHGNTDRIVVSYCKNLDGSTKCELIKDKITNPLTIAMFGEWRWSVWEARDPDNVQICRNEETAWKHFTSAMKWATNA